jgi:DNA polymerase III delta prime subunit
MKKTYLFLILFFPLNLFCMEDSSEQDPVYEVAFSKQPLWGERALDRMPNKSTGSKISVRGEEVDEKCVCGRYDLMPRPQPTAGHEKRMHLTQPVITSLVDQAPEGLQETIESHLSNPTSSGPLLLYFHGETGTGKTETAEALAQKYNLPWFSTAPHQLANQWEFSAEENMKWLLGQFADITRPHVLIFDCFSNYFLREEHNRVRAFSAGLSQIAHQRNLLLIGIEAFTNAQLPLALQQQFRSFEFSRYRTPAQIKQVILAHNYGYQLAEDVSEEFLLDLARRMRGEHGFILRDVLSDAECEKLARLGREKGEGSCGLSADPEEQEQLKKVREECDAMPISKQDFEAAYVAFRKQEAEMKKWLPSKGWFESCTIL